MGMCICCFRHDCDLMPLLCSLFCFFKQKTAYEMRISDWSSDVCSSDLGHGDVPAGDGGLRGGRVVEARGQFARQAQLDVARVQAGSDVGPKLLRLLHADVEAQQLDPLPHQVVADLHRLVDDVDRRLRSEEHTSELQSLMRISYAVFCL